MISETNEIMNYKSSPTSKIQKSKLQLEIWGDVVTANHPNCSWPRGYSTQSYLTN